MSIQGKTPIFKKILTYAPLILLFISVMNEFDVNYLNYKYFSFNFPFILIYYWSLKRHQSLGYGYIFIAGLFNDVVIGFPMGVSGLTYLLICGFAAYLRNITLRTNLINEWFFFLFTILVATAINYLMLISFFSIELNYYELIGNILFTFLLYYIFAHVFDFYKRIAFRGNTDD
mgnify:FL=1|tara:strand:- start:2331 stop:2852 length:522 start_codon:yes stop_codon:yes gene_type:complete